MLGVEDFDYKELLTELLALVPVQQLQEVETSSSYTLRNFLRSWRTGAPKEVHHVDESCTLDHTADFCLRQATKQGSERLTGYFLEKNAKDISGALIQAAEEGSFEIIAMLQDLATKQMFCLAAAHAALKGFFDLTKQLFQSGDGDDKDLNSILFMAITGGHVDIIQWTIQNGADTAKIPDGLIGRNIRVVSEMLESKEKVSSTKAGLYLFGVASFGDEQDIAYVLESFPYLKSDQEAIALAYNGALSNSNAIGIRILEPMLVIAKKGSSLFYQKLCTSAALGNNLHYVRKYLSKARSIRPALYVAVANGNADIVDAIYANRENIGVPQEIFMYAAYSGSSEMLQKADKEMSKLKSFSSQTEQVAYGAAAGGNWEYLESSLIVLRLNENINEVLTQIFTEIIHHSQLSILELLYSMEKDLAVENDNIDVLRDILESSISGKSLLLHLRKQTIHPAVLRRLDEILS